MVIMKDKNNPFGISEEEQDKRFEEIVSKLERLHTKEDIRKRVAKVWESLDLYLTPIEKELAKIVKDNRNLFNEYLKLANITDEPETLSESEVIDWIADLDIPWIKELFCNLVMYVSIYQDLDVLSSKHSSPCDVVGKAEYYTYNLYKKYTRF